MAKTGDNINFYVNIQWYIPIQGTLFINKKEWTTDVHQHSESQTLSMKKARQ